MPEHSPDGLSIPREELEPVEGLVLPADRPGDHFALGDSAVVFAPVTNVQRSLKAGSIERLSSNRVTVRLDIPPPRVTKYSRARMQDQGSYSIGSFQPLIMRPSEYELLFGNEDLAAQWVQSGNVDAERHRSELFRQLTRVGICERIVGPPQVDREVRTMFGGSRRATVRRIRRGNGAS